MSIELAAPPKLVDRQSYKRIMEAVLAADGGWVKVTLDEVAGQNNQVKQTRLWHAAHSRGIQVRTTVQEGFLYVRLFREVR